MFILNGIHIYALERSKYVDIGSDDIQTLMGVRFQVSFIHRTLVTLVLSFLCVMAFPLPLCLAELTVQWLSGDKWRQWLSQSDV